MLVFKNSVYFVLKRDFVIDYELLAMDYQKRQWLPLERKIEVIKNYERGHSISKLTREVTKLAGTNNKQHFEERRYEKGK